MKRERWVWPALGLLSFCVLFVAFRARSETLERDTKTWRNESSARWADAFNRANPDAIVPDPLSVAGSGPVEFLPKVDGSPPKPPAGMRFTWPHDLIGCELETTSRAGQQDFVASSVAMLREATEQLPPR